VVALILDAILSMWKKGVKDIPCVLICAASFVVSAFTSFSPILLVICCAVAGIVIRTIAASRADQKGGEGK